MSTFLSLKYFNNLSLIVHFIIWLSHYELLLTQVIVYHILHFLTYSRVHTIMYMYINDPWEVEKRFSTIHYISYLRWNLEEPLDIIVVNNESFLCSKLAFILKESSKWYLLFKTEKH